MMIEQELERRAATGIPNPFELKRPGREVHYKTFTDEDQPGVTLELSLRKPDAIDMGRCAAQVGRMTELYITGNDEIGPGPFPLVGGEMIPVSEELFGQACMVWAMQAPPGENRQSRRWEPEHLVAWALTMPNAWRAVLRFVDEIGRTTRRAEGNGKAPTE